MLAYFSKLDQNKNKTNFKCPIFLRCYISYIMHFKYVKGSIENCIYK